MDEQEGNADAPASPSNAIETAENLNGVTDENVDDVDASTLTVAVDAAVALSVESPSPHEISPAVTADFSDVNLCDSPIREFSPPQENSSSDLAVGTATLSLNSDSESERKDVIIKKQGPDPPKVYSTPYVEQEDKRPPIEIFMELKTKIEKGDVSNKDIVGKVLKIMVGGTFDLETKFVVQDANNIKHMLDLLEICQPNLQAELWSVFIAVVRKSTRNLQACTEVGLICELLQRLPAASDVVADLFIELLGVLASYSADVKEIKCFLSALRAADDEGKHERRWPRHSAKLLHVLKQLPKKDGPDVFFSFSGNKGAGIALPPLKSWSIQNGWTFNTWFRMDPLNSVNFEREKPFLFCFRTSKGVGYSAHFVGNCLVVTSAKTRTRGYQHCVKYEFSPRKWYMVSLVWVHNRWSKSEIRSYVNGQQIDTIEMSWFINTNEFDKCVIGSSFDTGNEPESSFCGQMGAVYAFADTLNMQQINSVYCLGPSYQSQFKYENETSLPDGYKKYLFDGKLSSSIMFSYCPKNCDRQLCLECSPKTNHSYFVHTPHALMQQDVTVVKTHSIHSTLHSVGGVQMLLPLFNQLDYPHDAQGGKQAAVDYSICSMLLSVICTLLEQSPSNQQQMFQNKGFLVISNALQSSCKRHLTENVLESFLSAAKFLLSSTTTGIPLLKHLFDYVLFNPALWVHTPAKIQLRLYQYLATDFLSNSQFYGNIRRVSTVLQMLHALKYYYWIVNPEAKSGYAPKATDGPRPSNMDVARIRSFMLQFVRKMMMRADGIKDDELQAVLNYLTTVHEDDNLYDVLQTAIALMADDPASMVPGFDRKRGICTVFKLVASANELIRIPGLKLLGYFLCRSTSKRKQDVMGPHNLFTLLTERLLLHTASLSMPTYNVLFEILTENMTPGTCYEAHATPDINARFENPMIIKVIANLITQSQPTRELLQVKQLFLTDLITLCGASRDNRRTVLQMSVWQEWLISLAHIFPVDGEERHVSDLVHQLFSMLLHHAIKLEYGGWRVWVDTLAIVHSKVSFEQFRVVMSQRYSIYRSERADTRMDPGERARLPVSTIEGVRPHDAEVGKVLEDVLDAVERELEGSANKQAGDDGKGESGNRQIFKTEPPRPIYRTPEFKWSHVHLRLLADLLLAIESDVAGWKVDTTRSVLEHVNATDNSIFVVNTVHVISQLVDNLIMAVGGLLPLLAAATSPNSELEITDGTSQGLSVGIATALLVRFVNLVDVFVFASSVGFSELEHEKNMPAGGILRQCLRLVSTIAVRNNLLCRYHRVADPATIAHDLSIDESIQQLISDPTGVQGTPIDVVLQAVSIQDFDFLLQEIDLNRLKAVIYRDMEETKQAQFLSLAVVYFVSVLMVSRYRDILEPPLSPSPFFDSSPSPQSRATPPGETPTKEVQDRTKIDENEQPAIENSVAEEKVEEDEAATIDTTEDRPKRATEQTEAEKPAEATTPGEVRPSAIAEAEGEEEGEIRSEDGEEEEKEVQPISAISGTSDAVAPSIDDGRTEQYKPADLHIAAAPQNVSRERQAQLTDKLCKALNNTAPLLREIMSDFHSFLQRTLLGTHGQEIMNDNRVIHTLRNQGGSVIELVMLLCSQEWQTSLQKHAGLAFIELVNEGRLLAHATRDHIVRVANEADFILNRLRAEDVSKHAEFETVCAQATLNRKQEESTCDHLIVSARRRDAILAMRLNDKILNVLCSEHGAWYDDDELMQTFWRLDVWEDDSRRRKRLVPNPYGSAHPNAALKGDGNPTEQEKAEADAAREDVLAELVCRRGMIVPPSRLAGHTADELIDEAELARLGEEDQDNGESVANFSTPAKLICPGAMVAGTLAITSNELYFDVAEDSDELQQQDAKVLRYCENLHGRWHFGEIRAIFLRRYLLQNTALELFLASRTAIMFAFSNHATVKRVVQHLPSVGVGVKYGLPQSRRASLMSPRQLYKHSDMSQRWQRREISNFDYLMFLNTIAGRTYNDLNQYPVFPWILSNYECDELDLNQPSNFRDLSKPIGAINPSRRAYFEERYSSWEHEHIPAFHYGTHYSTAAFVLNWMVRVEPFTTMFLNLQGGKFDVADRTFSSVSHAWRSCQRDTHDVKELIPEFFYLPEMLLNSNNYQFGAQDDGLMVNHVTLPAWAKNPEHFIAVHRAALESDLVSCQLHQWIDLIFGYKQRGPEAVRATNVFYYLTYEGSVDLSTLDDPIMKEALEGQIRNFGQTPSQLLSEPHPPRQSILTISPMVFAPVADDLCMVLKFISNSPIVHISANTHPSVASPTVISVTASLCFALNRWNNNYTGATNVPTLPNTPTASTAPTTIGEGGDAAQTQTVMPNLPLAVDPLLATGSPATPAARRNLGEAFDQRLRLSATNFVTTVDSRYIIAAGYADYSFRVISTENARVVQVVYGHKSVVTCVARSECNVVSDCYIATGSWDCTVLLWHWNAKVACVAGEYNAPGEVPSPRAVLTGHDDAITALVVSAEHGLVISGSSDGSVLVHTTSGDLLRCLTAPSPAHAPSALAMTRDCLVVVVYDHKHLCLYSAASGRLLTQRTGQTNSHVDTICLSRDGDYILCGGDEGVLNVFRLFNFEQLYSMPACDSSIKSVALTQNHSTVHYSCLIRASFRFALCGLSSGAIVVFNVDFNKWHPEYQQRYTAGR